jgi:hypothetical protein
LGGINSILIAGRALSPAGPLLNSPAGGALLKLKNGAMATVSTQRVLRSDTCGLRSMTRDNCAVIQSMAAANEYIRDFIR